MARSVLQYNAIIVPNSKKWFPNSEYSPGGFSFKTKTLCVGVCVCVCVCVCVFITFVIKLLLVSQSSFVITNLKHNFKSMTHNRNIADSHNDSVTQIVFLPSLKQHLDH